MNKKTLIAPVLATMLAVSCGGSGPAPKDWSKEIKDFMTAELGEVLPYMELDEASLVWDFVSDSWGGEFYAYDDNETNLTETYGAKLVEAGFAEEEGTYFKETSVSEVSIALSYYEGSGTEGEEGYIAPGNEIDIAYLYKTEPAGEWDETFAAFMDAKVTTSFPYLPIDVNEDDFHYGDATAMQYYAFGTVDQDETVTYGYRLAKAGFLYDADEEIWFKVLDDRYVTIEYVYIDPEEAAGYGYNSGIIEIDFANRYIYLENFPSDEAELFFEEEVEETIEVPELISENTDVYCYDEGRDYYGDYYVEIYAYGTTSGELGNYVSDLVDAGWLIVYYDSEDAYLMYPDSTIVCYVMDYNEYVDIDDPYTALISFMSTGEVNYADNTTTAYTIAFELGLDPEVDVFDITKEGDEYKSYSIMYSFANKTLDDVNTLVKSVVASVPDYYFSEELSSVEYSEEDPTVVEAYLNYFLIDNYEEGGQLVYFAVYPDDENVGQIAMYMVITGKPVEKIWGAEEVLLKLINESAIGSMFGVDATDLTDHSADAGYPYFQLCGSGQYWPAQYLDLIKYYWYSAISTTLKDFKTEQTQYLTREVTLGNGQTVTQYYVQFEWTSRDGSHRVIVEFNFFIIDEYGVFPSVEAVEVPSNPSALA